MMLSIVVPSVSILVTTHLPFVPEPLNTGAVFGNCSGHVWQTKVIETYSNTKGYLTEQVVVTNRHTT